MLQITEPQLSLTFAGAGQQLAQSTSLADPSLISFWFKFFKPEMKHHDSRRTLLCELGLLSVLNFTNRTDR